MGSDEDSNYKIAVVGMACEFPNAPDLNSFWKAVLEGRDLVTHFTKTQMAEVLGVSEFSEDLVGAYGLLKDADCFDHKFFGLSPREALRLDPQHRIFLQNCWRALEDAGQIPSKYNGRIGVFAGCGPSDHYQHLKAHPDKVGGASDWEMRVDTSADFLVARASFKLGLTGPSVAVQTACSTSLVAIHLGIQSLLAGESDLVLCGGVTASTFPKFPQFVKGGIISKDGFCRSFDSKADGTVASSGCGIVALKLLENAERDGDTIYCTVLGSCVNNDGHLKMNFSSPSLAGQREVISRTIELAGVEPDSIGFIEAHGTGTAIGDPIEITALHDAYQFSKSSNCYLGSVKSNVGHTDTAAGVCGFMKAALSVFHGVVPPTVHFETPNPNLSIESTSFKVNTKAAKWPKTSSNYRRAGVNSIGLGGTNVHVILEEYRNGETPRDDLARKRQNDSPAFFPLSAMGTKELSRQVQNLVQYLVENPGSWNSVANVLQTKRKEFSLRKCLAALTLTDLVRQADAAFEQSESKDNPAKSNPKLCFVFPGQGGQYVGMARAFYNESSAFSSVVDECLATFKSLGVDIMPILWPEVVTLGDNSIHTMANAQAAVLTVQLGLAKHFRERLEKKDQEIFAVLGHSLGAYAAACTAEVFSVQDACRIVHKRSVLFEKLNSGGMLAAATSEVEVKKILPATLSIAAINGPNQIVLSGPLLAIRQFAQKLGKIGIDNKEIFVSTAAHSSMLDPLLDEFRDFLASIHFRPPRTAVLSDNTGTWTSDGEINTIEYWVSHLRQTIRFSNCAEVLLQEKDLAVFEIGPGRTLTSLLSNHPGYDGQLVCQTLAHAKDDPKTRFENEALCRAWEYGVAVNWPEGDKSRSRDRISYPGYPFAKNRFKILDSNPIQIETVSSKSATSSDLKAEDHNPVLKQILDEFRDLFGDANINAVDSFLDLGGDSLMALRLFKSLKSKWGLEVSMEVLFRCQSPMKLADEIKLNGAEVYRVS